VSSQKEAAALRKRGAAEKRGAMKITIESTTKIAEIVNEGFGRSAKMKSRAPVKTRPLTIADLSAGRSNT
jgi:hypothetical protein